MLTARMAQSKNITLLEREKLNVVLKEQDFNATNRVNQRTKAKIGKVSGADAILFGDITIFGRDDTKKGTGVAARLPGGFGKVGRSTKRTRQ
jgi:curli biogenesis system outer membrane secretion channel CsgG